MYYLRARYYVPSTGRFLTVDKWPSENLRACDCAVGSGLSGIVHEYAFASSDPVSRIDPSDELSEEYGALTAHSSIWAARVGRTEAMMFSFAGCAVDAFAVEIAVLNWSNEEGPGDFPGWQVTNALASCGLFFGYGYIGGGLAPHWLATLVENALCWSKTALFFNELGEVLEKSLVRRIHG